FWWRRRNVRYVYLLYGLLLVIYLSYGLAFAATVLAIALLAAAERRWRVLLELVPAFVVVLLDAIARPHSQLIYRGLTWHFRQFIGFFAAGHIVIALLTLLMVIAAVIFAFVRSRPNPVALVS